MYARVVHVSLQAQSVTDATDYFGESVGPALKVQKGFKNSVFLVNPTTSQCMMVTLWDTEEDRTASESNGFLQSVLSTMKPYFGGNPAIEYYDVLVQA